MDCFPNHRSQSGRKAKTPGDILALTESGHRAFIGCKAAHKPTMIREDAGMLGRVLGRAMTAVLSVGLALPVWAETPTPGGKLTVELNKFEEISGGGCRAYFLFRNDTGASFEGFQMSLAVINKDGVIDRLLSIDASPLPVARTTLKLFEIPQIACANIGQVLLHDIPVCKPQNGSQTDCFPLIDLKSRTPAPLIE